MPQGNKFPEFLWFSSGFSGGNYNRHGYYNGGK